MNRIVCFAGPESGIGVTTAISQVVGAELPSGLGCKPVTTVPVFITRGPASVNGRACPPQELRARVAKALGGEKPIHVTTPLAPAGWTLVDKPSGWPYIPCDVLVVVTLRTIRGSAGALSTMVRGTSNSLPLVVSLPLFQKDDEEDIDDRTSLVSSCAVADPLVLTDVENLEDRVRILLQAAGRVRRCRAAMLAQMLEKAVVDSPVPLTNHGFAPGVHRLRRRDNNSNRAILLYDGPHLTADFVRHLKASCGHPDLELSMYCVVPNSRARRDELRSMGVRWVADSHDVRAGAILVVERAFEPFGVSALTGELVPITLCDMFVPVAGHLDFAREPGHWKTVHGFAVADPSVPRATAAHLLTAGTDQGAVCTGIVLLESEPVTKRARLA